MKYKILYALLFCFAALIIIGILLNLRLRKELQPQSIETTVSVEESIVPFDMPAWEPTATQAALPAGITVVKPAIKKPELSPAEKEKRKKEKQKASSAAQESAPYVAPDEDEGNTPASSTVKLNKYPSEIENKEMNERGIIMW